MSSNFSAVFEDSRGGIPIRLEAAPQTDAGGNHYAHYRMIASEGRAGAVIVGVRGDEVVLVRSHRESAGRLMWELPRGAGDRGDNGNIAITGERELQEETGYPAERVEQIGTYITDSTVFPHPMGTILCEVSADAKPGATDGEVAEVRWFTKAKVMGLIADGTIADAHSLSSLAIWFASQMSVPGDE